MVKRVLVVMCLVAVGGCLGGADGVDKTPGVTAGSDVEAKQGALRPVTCAHSPCVQGGALTPGCGPNECVAWICGEDPYCCSIGWIKRCVDKVNTVCQKRCNCDKICSPGNAYYPDACDCVVDVVAAYPSCGEISWKAQCIQEANNTCHKTCTIPPSPPW